MYTGCTWFVHHKWNGSKPRQIGSNYNRNKKSTEISWRHWQNISRRYFDPASLVSQKSWRPGRINRIDGQACQLHLHISQLPYYHHIILDQLHTSFGICNTVLDWLSSYIENRKQFISLGHSRSITTTCTTGMPQGSVLGPILFSLLVSPYHPNIATKYGVHQQQYADDT